MQRSRGIFGVAIKVLCLLFHQVSSLSTQSPENVLIIEKVSLQHSVHVPGALQPQSNSTLSASDENAVIPVIIYSSRSDMKDFPVITILNGFSVEAKWYSAVAEKLATLGYLVAVPEYRRPRGFPASPGSVLPRPGCDPNMSIPSGSLVGTIMTGPVVNSSSASQSQQLDTFRKAATSRGMVLLAHSTGGRVALGMILDRDDNICTLTPSGNYIDAVSRLLCNGYTPDHFSSLPNILGLIMYDGFGAPTPRDFLMPNNTFVMHMGSEGNTFLPNFINSTFRTRGHANATTSNQSTAHAIATNQSTATATTSIQSICTGYFEAQANHFGINNYVPGVNGTQTTPCAQPLPSNYTTTREKQELVLDLIARVVDVTIRMATTHGEKDVADQWDELMQKQYANRGMIDKACFGMLAGNGSSGQVGGQKAGVKASSALGRSGELFAEGWWLGIVLVLQLVFAAA